MSPNSYEEIDHTADLALRVWGEEFYSLLDHSAHGMYHLLGITANHTYPVEWMFMIEDGSRECMLVDFLSEVLYLCEDKKFVFNKFQYCHSDGNLKVNATGFQKVSMKRMIKAVTFHNLEIKETEFGFETTITFDV